MTENKNDVTSLPDDVYEKTDTSVRLAEKAELWKNSSDGVAVFFVITLLAVAFLGMAVALMLKGEMAEGVTAAVLVFAGMTVFCGVFLHRRTVTLDEAGLRIVLKLFGVTFFRRRYPLETVREFRVEIRTGGSRQHERENLYARISPDSVKVRERWIYSEHGQKAVMERTAEEMNAVLARVKETAGVWEDGKTDPAGEKWDSEFTQVLNGKRFKTEAERPEECRWMLEETDGGLRFWRKAGSWWPTVICALIGVAGFSVLIPSMTTTCHWASDKNPENAWEVLVLILSFASIMPAVVGMMGALLGLLEVFGKEHYRLTPRTLEWRRYAVKSEKVNTGDTVLLPLEACAEVEMYACHPSRLSVGPEKKDPWDLKRIPKNPDAEEYRLAFYDGQRKCLAEIIRLTHEEAIWMRDEVLRFFVTQNVAPKEVTANDGKKFMTEMEIMEDALAFGKRTVDWTGLIMPILFGGMIVWMLCLVEWSFLGRILLMPFVEWDTETRLTLIVLGIFGLLVGAQFLLPLGFVMGMFLTQTWRRETWRLDETGFRYVFRSLFVRRKTVIPPEKMIGFRVVEQELGNVRREWLVAETGDGRLPIAQAEYEHTRKKGPFSEEFREIAEQGNRLLAKWENSQVTSVEGVALPRKSRWRTRWTEAGVEFRKSEPFSWGGMVLPTVTLTMTGLLTAVVVYLFSLGVFGEMMTQKDTGRDGVNALRMLTAGVPMVVLITAWCLFAYGLNVTRWLQVRHVACREDGFYVGSSLFGFRREKPVAESAGTEVVVRDDGWEEVPHWRRETEFMAKMEMPMYTVVARNTAGETHTLAEGLTRDEAQWMAGEWG